MSTPLQREREQDPGTAFLWDHWMAKEGGAAVPERERERAFRRWLRGGGVMERDYGVTARVTDKLLASGRGTPLRPAGPGGRRRRPRAKWRYSAE